MHDSRDQINRLTHGKSTFLKLGSRSVPHRLTLDEREKFELALKKGYLTFKPTYRSSLKNSFTDYKTSEGFEPIILDEDSNFPVEYNSILTKIDLINPVNYSETRNYLSGQVTKLSPYITRGVISVKKIWDNLFNKNPTLDHNSQILKELAWREYFLRVRENLGDNIFKSIKTGNVENLFNELPKAIVDGTTGIETLDKEIRNLINQGYIHNHSRMWIASVVANISKTNWKIGADWMYYHLLDGELSSNYLSWQWIAGTLNMRKYYANQDNINIFSKTIQKNTFLDHSYEELPSINTPEVLQERIPLEYKNQVRQIQSSDFNKNLETLLYSAWNLDPNWYSNDNNYQRILLLEPSHFDSYPVSAKVLSFIIKLSKQIKGLKIVVKDYKDLGIDPKLLITKSHINTRHWKVGNLETEEYIFPEVTGYYESFFSYWKECLRFIK